MKRIALSIAVAIAGLLVFHASYRAQSAFTIEGIVKDAASGQPLSGVQVGLSSRGVAPVAYNPPGVRVPPTSAITDSQGRFSIETKDVLSEGLDIPGDTELEIVLGASGGLIQGTVRDATGNTLPDAVVGLVPDAPRRKAGPLYQSVITDPNAKFEIHGIAPGSYKLFAWPELEGLAYRNAEFMKEFEDRGKPVKVEKGVRLAVDLTAF